MRPREFIVTAIDPIPKAVHRGDRMTLAMGGVNYDCRVVYRRMGSPDRTGVAVTSPSLTDREEKLLRLYCRYHTYKRVACEAGLATNTVSQAVSRACRRNGADGVLDLLRRLGWLMLPDT